MAALIVDFRKHSGPTPVDHMAPKSSLTVETSHWTSSNVDSMPLHLISKWHPKFTFIWKEDFEWILLDNPLKAVVIAVAPFPTTLFSSTQLSMNMLGYSTVWTTSFFSSDLLWLTLCLLDMSHQQSSLWLWSLLTQTERPFKGWGINYLIRVWHHEFPILNFFTIF